MVYRIKPVIAEQYPQLSTIVPIGNGKFKSVCLTGQSYTVETPGDKDNPPTKIVVPAATQSEMKQIHEAGNPFTEAIEASKEKV